MRTIDDYRAAVESRNAREMLAIAIELASHCACFRLCDLCRDRLQEAANVALSERDHLKAALEWAATVLERVGYSREAERARQQGGWLGVKLDQEG